MVSGSLALAPGSVALRLAWNGTHLAHFVGHISAPRGGASFGDLMTMTHFPDPGLWDVAQRMPAWVERVELVCFECTAYARLASLAGLQRDRLPRSDDAKEALGRRGWAARLKHKLCAKAGARHGLHAATGVRW